MRRSDKLPGGLCFRAPIGALFLFAILTLVLAGCAGNRSSPSQAWSGLAVDGSTGYIGTQNGEVIAVDLEAQGRETASFAVGSAGRTDAFPGFYGVPTIANGKVYVGGFNGIVYALDATGLIEVRSFEIEGDKLSKGILGSIVTAGTRFVFGGSESADTGRLYVLDEDLREVCVYPARGNDPVGAIWSTPTVVDGIAYFGDLSHNLYAIAVDDCEPVWAAPVGLGGGISAPVLVLDNKLYVGSFNQTFYAIDLETAGASAVLEADNWFWAKAATDETRVFAPSLDGRLYAYDLTTRRVAWVYPADGDIGPIISAPVVVGDTVVVGSDDENIVVLDAATGTRLWDQRVGSKIRAPLTAAGSVVYVYTIDRVLRAYDVVDRRLLWEQDLGKGR